jgi:hypothetical protein
LNIVVTVWEMEIPNEAIAGSGENTLLIGSSPVAGTTSINVNKSCLLGGGLAQLRFGYFERLH